jgi:type II secretory pathway predicted ATPase ExeA
MCAWYGVNPSDRTDMYETCFGLNKRPFRALATGSDVFVGPQTAAIMVALKKSLVAPDTIVTVSGPVGVGKTTLVRRALEAVGDSQDIITVGRMKLGHDEVLELLLEEMGAELPAGTVQRFTTFRHLLKQRADKGTRVFVVVEDAARIGADALSELEALTASDAGVSDGANIVLMGDQDMNEVLQTPRLARLKQRMRLRQTISPLSAGELTAYFKQCFRLAGGDFDALFEPGTSNLLHALSGGIPRMANNLVESALTSAAESKQDRIGVALIKLIATEEYGLNANQHAPAATSADTPVVDRKVAEAPITAKEEPPIDKAETEVVAAQAPLDGRDRDDAIPELIQDTLPDLEILAPNLARSAIDDRSAIDEKAEGSSKRELPLDEPAFEDGIPTLSSSNDSTGLSGNEIPEWERDPTLAQLRPDLDALEHAMAVAQGLEPDDDDELQIGSKSDEPEEPVPEITLDREIQAKIDEATELLKEAEREAAERDKSDDDASNDTETPATRPAVQVKAPRPVAQATPPPVHKPAVKVTPSPAPRPAVNVAPPAAPKPAANVAPPAAPKPAVNVAPPPAPEPAVNPTPVPKPVVRAEPPQAPAPAVRPESPEPRPIPVVRAQASQASPIPVAKVEPTPKPAVAVPDAAETPGRMVVADEAPAKNVRAPDAEFEKIAANLARARTIDDCDDKMAETLFGEEFSMMAAQIAANAPPELSANDELELVTEKSAAVPLADSAVNADTHIELDSRPSSPHDKLDHAHSQRLATVRALNRSPDMTPPVAQSAARGNGESPPEFDQPESIEEQINTSMTQTLKALSVRPPPNTDDDDDEDKGGFFSRFRRS